MRHIQTQTLNCDGSSANKQEGGGRARYILQNHGDPPLITLTHGGGVVPVGHVTASTSTPHFLISCFSVADRATTPDLGWKRSALPCTKG